MCRTASPLYQWDWNDSTTLNAVVPSVQHTFVNGGTYNLHLAVVDASGVSFDTTQAVVVP